MTQQATAGPGTSREAAGHRSVFGIQLPARKARTRDIVALTRELATLLEAGVSVVPALELLHEQRAGTSLEPIIAELVQDLNAGRQLAEAMESFDLVLLDPPYASDELQLVLEGLVESGLLAREATVVVEASKRHSLAPVAGLVECSLRCYGDTQITRLRRLAPADPSGSAGGADSDELDC